MDHLNIFNSYKKKSNNHEDELTRCFLILVKNVPIVQVMFFEMIKKQMNNPNLETIANGELFIEEIFTQLSNTNNLFSSEKIEARTLVSIIISDDKLESDAKVKNDDRQARYDGVILSSPSWLFIIENKPSKENIWLGQLNPNIEDEKDVTILENPCCLSWRDIMSNLSSLIQNKLVTGAEEVLMEDFIEYVDNEYSWINPYNNFSICKNNIYLLNKRCNSIMGNFKINGEYAEVKYHRGWKHYIESGKNTVKQIALDANKLDLGWEVNLWLHTGDTMNAARTVFEKLDIDKLMKLQTLGFKLSTNFHFAYRSSNLLWFDGNLSFEDYIKYWKDKYKNLKQIKRADFLTFFDEMENNQMIVPGDRSEIQEKILNKNYDKLNICPGFLIRYTWSKDEAIRLDKSNNFEENFKNKVKAAFNVMGGI
jgi:hypothetical protein